MKVKIQDGVLELTPESEEDQAKLNDAFGQPDSKKDSHGKREFAEKTFGFDVYLADDGKSVAVGVREAWWNYDD